MMFLTDHELPSESIDNIDDPSPSTSIINSTQQISETVEDISDSESVKHSVEVNFIMIPIKEKLINNYYTLKFIRVQTKNIILN